MKLVYIAHPFSDKQEVESIILELLKKYPDVTYYSPVHATGFFYDAMPYEQGKEHCYEALSRCDELWLCEGWQDSQGCNLEYAYCKGKGIPMYRLAWDSVYQDYTIWGM